MLMIGPVSIIIFLIVLFALVVYSLFLASKSKSNGRFLVWGAIILFVPVIGALACIISHYSQKTNLKTI